LYPAQFFHLFPAFPRSDTTFVAMSFHDAFAARWKSVLAPAIKLVNVNGSRLTPVRVDARKVSDSILTEILDGIGRSRVVVADITAQELGGTSVRNGNVMYEVGLAHATRLPEEVLLFRSDDARLLFDVAQIRVNRYDPDGNPETARQQVADSIVAALRELELRRHRAVEQAASQLDYPSWMLLVEAQQGDGIAHPTRATMGQVLGAIERADAIARLLDLGAIEARFVEVTVAALGIDGPGSPGDIMKYRATPFGHALAQYGFHALGLAKPEIRAMLEPSAGTSASLQT
jgi:hypothetical protein